MTEPTCDDCRHVDEAIPPSSETDLDGQMSDAGRHIAYGVERGAWACDHVEWSDHDVAQAYAYLHKQEVRSRDQARARVRELEAEVDLRQGSAEHYAEQVWELRLRVEALTAEVEKHRELAARVARHLRNVPTRDGHDEVRLADELEGLAGTTRDAERKQAELESKAAQVDMWVAECGRLTAEVEEWRSGAKCADMSPEQSGRCHLPAGHEHAHETRTGPHGTVSWAGMTSEEAAQRWYLDAQRLKGELERVTAERDAAVGVLERVQGERDQARADADRLREMLAKFVAHEDRPCQRDHHGDCQEHGWFADGEEAEGEEVCMVRKARRYLGLDGEEASE